MKNFDGILDDIIEQADFKYWGHNNLRLKVGKRYLTLDGRVAFISYSRPHVNGSENYYGVIAGSENVLIWNEDGTVGTKHHADWDRTIVSEI